MLLPWVRIIIIVQDRVCALDHKEYGVAGVGTGEWHILCRCNGIIALVKDIFDIFIGAIERIDGTEGIGIVCCDRNEPELTDVNYGFILIKNATSRKTFTFEMLRINFCK